MKEINAGKKMKLSTQLKKLHACTEGYEWAKGKTLTEAWSTCERGDWMLWYAAKINIDRKLLVRAACACARLALKFVPDGEQRPRIAIETAEAWTEGKASLEDVRTAADAAAYAATFAAYAAYAATFAAYAAYAAYAATLRVCAETVRSIIPLDALITEGKQK